jgi:hypothetical protein
MNPPDQHVIERYLAGIVSRVLFVVLVVAVSTYIIDWAVWQIRAQMGSGMGTATISRIQVATLKGNKEEYYNEGRSVVDCSHSLFRQAGDGACWWLARHPEVYDRE